MTYGYQISPDNSISLTMKCMEQFLDGSKVDQLHGHQKANKFGLDLNLTVRMVKESGVRSATWPKTHLTKIQRTTMT